MSLGNIDHLSTEDLITHIVARDVSFGFEMARSLGHRMPHDFRVGLSVLSRDFERLGWRRCYRIRVDDVTERCIVLVPHLDGSVPLARVSELWRVAMDKLSSMSVTMVHVWLDKHPEALMAGATARDALDRLMKVERSPEEADALNAAAKRAMQASTFRMVKS